MLPLGNAVGITPIVCIVCANIYSSLLIAWYGEQTLSLLENK